MNRVLVTGGTGKTGRRLLAHLQAQSIPCRLATRSSTTGHMDTVAFDWTKTQSWSKALEDVTSAYLVAPPAGAETASIMIDFAKRAAEHGTRRFVLLSASLLPAGSPGLGQVHQWLQDNAAEWAVLRPSWFMQNFSETQHLATIRDEGVIYSAAEDGRVPFISAEDIARAACAALTMQNAPNRDFILTGPATLSYDEVAAQISDVTGRIITHHRISMNDLAARHLARGMPKPAADILAFMDTAIAAGAEDRVTEDAKYLIGKPPTDFSTFTRANALCWKNS